MERTEIASDKLREIVARLRSEGLPPPQKIQAFSPNGVQAALLDRMVAGADKEKRLMENQRLPVTDPKVVTLRR